MCRDQGGGGVCGSSHPTPSGAGTTQYTSTFHARTAHTHTKFHTRTAHTSMNARLELRYRPSPCISPYHLPASRVPALYYCEDCTCLCSQHTSTGHKHEKQRHGGRIRAPEKVSCARTLPQASYTGELRPRSVTSKSARKTDTKSEAHDNIRLGAAASVAAHLKAVDDDALRLAKLLCGGGGAHL